MKVKEWIQELQKHNENMEVTITDGFEFKFYHTDGILITEFYDSRTGVKSLDIGIGGCEIKDEQGK
jgi:hypothetical protein